MAQFQYTAVNSSGKKLSGLIGAASEEEARKQLGAFGISLLGIQKNAETSVQSSTREPGTSAELQKFEFEAFDKSGKKVIGTIPASSRYKAFKRLMEEYQFEVSFVVPFGASDEEKTKAKAEDLSMLKAEYEAKNKVENPNDLADKKASAAFEEKRKALLQKVDFILGKIKSLLIEYQEDIKPEAKKIIQSTIDKLLRIKSSTNLDYIQMTSEELLKKVQDQELFLHKEKMQRQRDHLKLEAQKMMASLHTQPTLTPGITENLEEMQGRLQASDNQLFRGVAEWLGTFLPSPEEKTLQEKIRAINRQGWTYRRILWTAPKGAKAEARQSLKSILDEKARLTQELKALQRERKNQKKEVNEPLLTEEVNHFLSWLLSFYLVAYFFSYYASAKVFPGGNPLPGDFNLLASPTLRHLLLTVFLWHIVLSLRVDHLRYKAWANAVLIPLGIVLNITLVFNL
ncbi:MAG: hypothetical protein WC777_04890 [Candidatus Gracilibacteria bacterium]|jgi:hypothetical protein